MQLETTEAPKLRPEPTGLRNELYSTYQSRIRQIEKILEDLRDYDCSVDQPKIDTLFEQASELRNRRVDFAVYNLAMESKRSANETGIELAKKTAMRELKRHLVQVRRNGLQPWHQWQ